MSCKNPWIDHQTTVQSVFHTTPQRRIEFEASPEVLEISVNINALYYMKSSYEYADGNSNRHAYN
jgi:hypothetical protein